MMTKCRAFMICKTKKSAPRERCGAESVGQHEGNPICWTHQQALKGPRYEKPRGVPRLPLEFD